MGCAQEGRRAPSVTGVERGEAMVKPMMEVVKETTASDASFNWGVCVEGEGCVRGGGAGGLGRVRVGGGEFADVILARLIEDREREVSLTAMDACFDRAASQVVVDALWNKVIVIGLRSMGANMEF